MQSLALYVLASFNRDQLKSSESGLKYFVLSALSSGLLLYGCSLVYGFSGSTNFNVIGDAMNSSHYGLTFGIVFILVGLAFKISAVPFHMWAPDVYEGSPTAVTLFFAIVPKVAALTVFIRFLYVPFVNMIDQWQPILIFLSIASMIFGAIAAIGQNNLKRLIAINLLRLFWPIAAIAPKIIDAIDKKINIGCHWSIIFTKGTYKNLINTVRAATFGTIAKNSVTAVGEPSYTSGAHMWNGTADILNAKPTSIKTIPKVKP